MSYKKLIIKIVIMSLFCSSIPLFSMQRAQRLARQLGIIKQEKTKNIFDAIEKNNIEAVQYWIDNKVNLEATDSIGFTPLTLAARNKNQKIISLLLDKGANINAKGPSN